MVRSFSRSQARTLARPRWLLRVGVAALAALLVSSPSAISAPAAEGTYIVQLDEPPLALYGGGVAGLAPTMPAKLGATRLNPSSPASVAYLNHLASRQNAVTTAIDLAVGRSVAVKFRYRAAYNGMAVQLTSSEAERVAGISGVKGVQPDERHQLLTDSGPAWIGAKAIHDATGGLPGTKGEGIVVGIIDTGINHDHPSFADIGGDTYNHTNPRTRHYGVCAPLNVVLCNDKLIGMYDFTGTTPFDDNAHGSHTASTVAGNVVNASLIAPTITYSRQISGVAPHANIIAYKACNSLPDPAGGCLVSGTVAAIDQATLDMVQVINFSIGGASRNPWTDPNALAFLGANAAGVFGSVSAGNEGPGSSTIGSPSDSPWVMSVGASTHDRNLLSQLDSMAGGAAAPPAAITGKSVAGGVGPASIVYAGAPPYNAPLCGAGTADPTTGVGSENPFDPGELAGKIVVCDRGTYGRVAKGQEVKDAGGIGMVLANDAASGDSLIADLHVLPAVHITYSDGQVLKNWIAAGGAPVARITGMVQNIAPANGDVMASFSSRGPNPSVPGVIKPDVTAPGVDVYAAFNTPLTTPPPPVGPTAPEYGIISGTSMSSPHAAGAAALLRAVKPNWTPSQLKSALMTTGFTTQPGEGSEVHGVLKEDASTAATPFEMGGGRVELRRAARAGLLLDVDPQAYLNANPALSGGDPKTLNIASMANDSCQTTCSWTRTVTSVAAGSWTATMTAPSGTSLSVTPATFDLGAGESQTLTISLTNTNLTPNAWRFGGVTLSPNSGNVPATRLPVAVRAGGVSVDPCVIPDETVVTDPSNDQAAPDGVPNSPAFDIESVAAAGLFPNLGGSPNPNIHWTLKVRQLDPDNLPRNVSWRTSWTSPNGTVYFVDMNTFDPTGAVAFDYGFLDGSIFTTQGGADEGSFTPDGTIKITIAASKVGGPVIGNTLTAVNADTVMLVGGAGTGLLANLDSTGNGTYTLRGCGGPQVGPDAVNDTVTTPEGAAITINVLANDTHPQNATLTVTGVTEPAHGSTAINPNGTITYTPTAAYSGSDTFTYTVSDPQNRTDTASVFVTVESRCATGTYTDNLESGAPGWTVDTPVNENPASVTWSVLTDPGTTSPMNSWFTDATTLLPKDDRLAMPAQDLTGASLLTFWHRFGFEDGFDGGVLEVSTDGGDVWKDILDTGATFDAGGYNGTISTEYGSPIGGQPAWTGGPIDAVLAPMTQVTVNVGALAGPDVLFRFRLATDRLELGALPGAGWWIDDVTVTNTALDCPPPPNQPPVAQDDAATTNKNTAVTINVLANDSDPDGDPLAADVIQQPANGTATRNADNTVTYTPNTAFVGQDAFRYEIYDPEGGTSTATVTVTVLDASGPTPCFKYSPKKPNKNTRVEFDATCSSDEQSPDSQLVFEWDFRSDGTYDATGIKVKHRFGAAGTYTVTLRVTDPGGLANTTTKQITVKHDDDDDDDDGPEHGGGDDDDDDGGDD